MKNLKIVVFDNNSRISRIHKKKKSKNIIYVNGDIRNKSKLNLTFKKFKINTIIHLAYINGTKFFYNKPCEIIDVAAKGMQNVIELGVKYRTPNFFLASSSEVYRATNNFTQKVLILKFQIFLTQDFLWWRKNI